MALKNLNQQTDKYLQKLFMIKNIFSGFNKKNRYLLFVAAIMLNIHYGLAQKKIAKNEMTADFLQLKKQLSKLHQGLFYYETPQEFENRYVEIIEHLPDTLDESQAYFAVNQLIAGMKDLHTSVYFPKKLITNEKNKTLPLSIRKIGEKYYVHLNASTDSTLLRGQEIISVDSVKIKDIILKSRNLWGTDNGNLNSKNYYSERYLGRNITRLYGIKDSLFVELRDIQKDSIYDRKLATESAKNISKTIAKRYKNINRQNLSLKIIDSLNHVAMMDVLSFTEKGNRFDFHNFKFARLLKRNFRKIDENNIQHLLVDFRFNGGGLLANTKRITKYIANEPFTITHSIKLSKSAFHRIFPQYSPPNYLIGRLIFKKQNDGSYLKVAKKQMKPSKKHHYSGKIYVLTDGGSYSATTLTIGLWKDMNRAMFIGNTPGGANWGSFAGQWKDLKLKNSKIKVHIPLMKLIHAHPYQTNKTFFVEPDYYVEPSFEDFLKRKDAQVNFVLDLIKNK
jgi:hypothetical protein